ncbi:MAG: Sugar or sugar phosphate isomerase/epimerase/dehydrotase [Cytophagales bacterium]|jgi:sugar phosphate isomerase/epimerase|nr:sugar phosphate isomerase/epimerase [Bacteroidota bacterium]MBS1981310.1 sugar phosphate isomerase/epimerase [Bacteroidota bacterium]WHZ09329.1 MAG: Sugar or sugar phosphate isomerase/epimerase/dehydrotase [Cytophagales bacterium]
MKRRKFIQSGAMAAAALTLPSFGLTVPRKKIGLQLYSLRDIIFKDPEGTLKKIAEYGYQELETFGYNNGKLFGKTISEFSKLVSDFGMKATSGHYSTGQGKMGGNIQGSLKNGWEKACTDAKTLGQEYMVIAYLEEDERKTLDDYRRTCELINKQAEVCKAHGLRMGYHNHAFEFEPIGNEIPYHIMLKELDPKLVSMEMDIYWVVYANHDPLKMIADHPGRFEQWHVKDMRQDDRKLNADVGTGIIDFKSIFAKASESGLKHFYIEQETYPSSSAESIKNCSANIKKMLG